MKPAILSSLLPYLLASFSGILVAVSLPGFNLFPLALVAPIPLLYALQEKSFLHSITIATASGLSTGIIYFTWSLTSALRYTGSVSAKNVFIYIALCLYHSLWSGIFGAGYYVIHRKRKFSPAMFIIATVSLWVVIEWLHQNILPSIPWIIILPYTQWNNLFLLQWMSLGGMWLVSVIIVAFAIVLYDALVRKKSQQIVVAALVLSLVHGAGYVMYLQAKTEKSGPLSVAIIQENINAKSRWDDAFVDSLVHILLDLNRRAATMKPHIIVWTETAIPWTFQEDDDLLMEALRTTYSSGASHLVGMLTPADTRGQVFNSLYYIEPDGAVTGRYDKRELLSFLERPFIAAQWQLPFAQSRYTNILAGKRPNVLVTRYGTFGAMICNEVLSPSSSVEAARGGAQALVAASNDSWFFGSVLTTAHLALTRLRAIETRKDIIVNANGGFSGIIESSGDMTVVQPSETPHCSAAGVHVNTFRTFYVQFPDAVVYLGLCALCLIFLYENFHYKSHYSH